MCKIKVEASEGDCVLHKDVKSKPGETYRDYSYDLIQNNKDDSNPTYTLVFTSHMPNAENEEDAYIWGSSYAYNGDEYRYRITEIKFVGNVTKIDQYALYWLPNVEKICFPDALISLPNNLYYSKLKSVTFGSRISEIDNSFFKDNTSLEYVDISNTNITTGLSSYEFDGCTSLKTVKLPKKLTHLNSDTFRNCTSLEKIDLPDSITWISDGAFHNCSSLKEVDIPANVSFMNLGPVLINCDSLETVRFANDSKLEILGDFFMDCDNIKNIYLPANTEVTEYFLKDIGENVNIFAPAGSPAYDFLTKNGRKVEIRCAYESHAVASVDPSCTKDGVKGYYACVCGKYFEDAACKTEIKELAVWKTTTGKISMTGHKYGQPTFTWTDFTEAKATFTCENDANHKEVIDATITSTVTKEATTSAEGVKTYTAKVTFEGKDYIDTKTEVIPKSGAPKKGDKLSDDKTKGIYLITNDNVKKGEVTYIGSTDKKATKITIPDKIVINNVTYKVTKIKDKAFKGNKKLKTVIIGKNITTIGKSAFDGCKNLKSVTIKTTKLTDKKVGSKAFKGIHAKAKVKVPKAKLKAYKKILKKKGISGKNQKITK